MGASTRAALETLRSQVASVAASSDLVSGVCGVGRAIAQHPSLLQAMADQGHSAEERVALLNGALKSAPSDVRDVVALVVTQSWSKPGDLLAGVEELAVRLASMASDSADVTGELLQVGRAIRGHSDLQLAMSDKRAQSEDKMAVVEAWVPPERASRYVAPDTLHQIFGFDFLVVDWNAAKMRDVVQRAIDGRHFFTH